MLLRLESKTGHIKTLFSPKQSVHELKTVKVNSSLFVPAMYLHSVVISAHKYKTSN